jgi:hypothetical protein
MGIGTCGKDLWLWKRERRLVYNQAIELDPLSNLYRGGLAMIAFLSRQYDLSIKLSENLSDDLSINDEAALCYAMKKMYPEAIAITEKAVARRERQTGDLRFLALVYGLAGRKSGTKKIIGE